MTIVRMQENYGVTTRIWVLGLFYWLKGLEGTVSSIKEIGWGTFTG